VDGIANGSFGLGSVELRLEFLGYTTADIGRALRGQAASAARKPLWSGEDTAESWVRLTWILSDVGRLRRALSERPAGETAGVVALDDPDQLALDAPRATHDPKARSEFVRLLPAVDHVAEGGVAPAFGLVVLLEDLEALAARGPKTRKTGYSTPSTSSKSTTSAARVMSGSGCELTSGGVPGP